MLNPIKPSHLDSLTCSSAAGQAPGDAFRPVGEGNSNLFRAAAAAGARRFIITGSCNSRAHRNEYEVRRELSSGTMYLRLNPIAVFTWTHRTKLICLAILTGRCT